MEQMVIGVRWLLMGFWQHNLAIHLFKFQEKIQTLEFLAISELMQ